MQTTSTDAAFAKFHADNPNVYTRLVEEARRLKRAGRTRYGINSLCEVIRWHTALQTIGEPYKMNNSYRPLYARLIMENCPDLSGFFETRERRAA